MAACMMSFGAGVARFGGDILLYSSIHGPSSNHLRRVAIIHGGAGRAVAGRHLQAARRGEH